MYKRDVSIFIYVHKFSARRSDSHMCNKHYHDYCELESTGEMYDVHIRT